MNQVAAKLKGSGIPPCFGDYDLKDKICNGEIGGKDFFSSVPCSLRLLCYALQKYLWLRHEKKSAYIQLEIGQGLGSVVAHSQAPQLLAETIERSIKLFGLIEDQGKIWESDFRADDPFEQSDKAPGKGARLPTFRWPTMHPFHEQVIGTLRELVLPLVPYTFAHNISDALAPGALHLRSHLPYVDLFDLLIQSYYRNKIPVCKIEIPWGEPTAHLQLPVTIETLEQVLANSPIVKRLKPMKAPRSSWKSRLDRVTIADLEPVALGVCWAIREGLVEETNR